MKRLIAVMIAAAVLLTGCIQLPIFTFGTDGKAKTKAEKVKSEREKPNGALDDQGTPDSSVKPKQKSPGQKGK
ncbi:MAG TPA: hypothetical protein VNT01_16860 [Symbiobacteriaceae bacterium]|nr:hypothetical protein [Symbiobacteriaceae bacterium]